MSPLARKIHPALLLAAGILLSACASLQPQDFAHSPSHFELDRYFVGHNRSWGLFENTSGQPQRAFVCDSYGRRDAAGDLVLTQHFRFSNGKAQERLWHIHRVDTTHWDATANDMIGIAHGQAEGNALYWEYTITLDRKNPLATVHIRQWIYQIEGTTTLMTHLIITKLGLPVFEVSETIHPVTAP